MQRFAHLLSLLLAGVSAAVGGAQQNQTVVLEDAAVRVEAWIDQGQIHERYMAKGPSGWVRIADSAGDTMGPVSVKASSGVPLGGANASVEVHEGIIDELCSVPTGFGVRRTIALAGRGWLKVTSTWNGSRELHSFEDRFRFAAKPDWSYAPSVGGFVPDAQYKAPVILVQAAGAALGIVPDLTTLDREVLRRSNHALDLDVPSGPVLTVGFTPAHLAFHSVFGEDLDRNWLPAQPVANSYYLMLTATAQPGLAYREAVRFLWQRFGRPSQASAAVQQSGTDPKYKSLALWDDWRRVLWDQESPATWVSVPLPNGSKGGAVRMIRWGGPRPSLYLGAWFNSLRTAHAMALYARREGKKDLLDLAAQTLNAALRAPGVSGAFKCVAVPSNDGVAWAAGDGSGVSTQSGFLGFDMAWTGYWLLKWRAAQLPGSEQVLTRCRRLADFFIARQEADGMLPTRFDESGAPQAQLSRIVQAETGVVARFLLELYAQDRKPAYLTSAQKALAFLDRQVVPQRKWYDFETFWSCSPRLIAFDERTGQWPANNLALIHAAGAYLSGYELTGEQSYLSKGEALLDYLLLYQQVWTNPLLADLTSSAMLLGGFTTQNSDAEWSDARQSLCGNLLIDYYRVTGKTEYLERGVAALRAQFPISPSENWAHAGYGKKAGVSGFHWGSGSGMAGIEINEDYLHDAVCDLHSQTGVGVNGVNVTAVTVSGDRVALAMDSPFQWEREPVITFRGSVPSATYRLAVNGKEAGTFKGAELESGVKAPGFRHRR